MSNSPLVNYTRISPNRTVMSNKKNTHIVIHHMAGNLTVETCGAVFAPTSRKASSQYGIGTDGRVGQYCPESDRAWTTGSYAIDSKAVTIEVANDSGAPTWHVSDTALKKLIELCVDICKRNGIKRLNYTGDKSGNLHKHEWYQNTNCIPTNSELLTRNGWVKLSDIEVGDEVACADLDNLNITFEEVYDKVPTRQQDTYTNHGLTATKDHRMVYRIQSNPTWRIELFNKLLEDKGRNLFIPTAGNSHFDGLMLSDDMIAFYIAVQADGHYMYKKDSDGEKRYYGLEFHFSKKRKIERIKEILERIHLEYRETNQSNGTTKIRVYNADGINIINDICEKYLKDKCFTWEWINLSPSQAAFFLDEIMEWDGCKTGKKYSSTQPINLDIVNAIAALNNVNSKVVGTDVFFMGPAYTGILDETKRNSKQGGRAITEVSCVSVKTGIILIRQNGRTFIVGNCPGPYLGSKFNYIASEVNKKLNSDVPSLVVDGYDYANVYNFEFYINKYKDLKETFGDDQYAAFDHFLKHGMREGRQAKANFIVGIYKDNYIDLRNAFGNDLPKYYRHYIKYGIGEKRVANYHVIPVSKYEEIDYSPVYDGKYYVDKYADLKKAFGNNYDKLIEHFVNYGMKECRQAKSTFNVDIYKSNYEDLRKAFGNDMPKYYMHFIKYGMKEGRIADRTIKPFEYTIYHEGDSIEDIAKSYNMSVNKLLELNGVKFKDGQKLRVR